MTPTGRPNGAPKRYDPKKTVARIARRSLYGIDKMLKRGAFPKPRISISKYHGWDLRDIKRWQQTGEIPDVDTIKYLSVIEVEKLWGIGRSADHFRKEGTWVRPAVIIARADGEGEIREGYDLTDVVAKGKQNKLLDHEGRPIRKRRTK